ncbi:MAG: helix-turn-helix domain-containing protein [Alphaproteobacteria bacterium]|nr:helix-turn-helix domain-containing protein [Alphaproteobacteria bacterium]
MLIRSPSDLGAAIRNRRRELGLDQAALAKSIGASRQWVIGVERGRARAELGLVLRALDILDIPLSVDAGTKPKTKPAALPDVDIDAIVDAARNKRRP